MLSVARQSPTSLNYQERPKYHISSSLGEGTNRLSGSGGKGGGGVERESRLSYFDVVCISKLENAPISVVLLVTWRLTN